jgi:mannose-1-phosphate guanylyltransferase
MVPTTFSWDDVGSWNSLAFLHRTDREGNVVIGRHVGVETENSILVGQPGHLLATMGVKDLIVVHSPDATLVCHKTRAQAVRQLVARLSGSPDLRRYL